MLFREKTCHALVCPGLVCWHQDSVSCKENFFLSYANEILFSSCVFQKRNCFLLIYVKCPVAHHVMFTPVTCMFMCCHGDRVHNDVHAVHEVADGQCSQG